MTAAPLADQRTDAVLAIAELERQQGAALLDGKPFDESTLTAQRTNLQAIDAAEAEAGRRERAAQDAASAERRAELRKRGAEELQAFQKAVDDAEAAGALLIAALASVIEHTGAMAQTARALGIRPPIDQDPGDPAAVEKAISLAVGHALDPLGKVRRRFGYLAWPSSPTPQTFAGLSRLAPDFEQKGRPQ